MALCWRRATALQIPSCTLPLCGPHPAVGLLCLGLALLHLLPVGGHHAFPLLTLLKEQVLQLLQLRLVDGRKKHEAQRSPPRSHCTRRVHGGHV